MVLDQRRIAILSYLHSLTSPINLAELAENLGVSKRTLYHDLNEVDHWLIENHVPAIQRKYGEGLFLEHATKERLSTLISLKDQWAYRLSQEERHYVLLAHLFLQQSFVSSKQLMDIVQVSRGTIFKDLASLSEQLQKDGILLTYDKQKGYQLTGSEYALWQKIQQILQTVTDDAFDEVRKMLFHQVHSTTEHVEVVLQQEIKKLEVALAITFNQQVRLALGLTLLFIYQRPLHELWIEQAEQDVLIQSPAFKAVTELSARLQRKGFRLLSHSECFLLVIRILSSRVTDASTRLHQTEQTDISQITKDIIAQFEYNSGVNFQDKDRLYKNLVAHIKPAYYRLKYDQTLSNRYLPFIEQQLKEVYTLTEQALQPLQQYVNVEIPREEIALIAMHFGGWINKKREKRHKAYKAVVICENGIAASSMLFSQLEGLLPEVEFLNYIPVRSFKSYEPNVDIAFSTTYISQSTIPVIYVPAILGESEKATIFRELQQFMDPARLKRSDFESVMQIIEQYTDIQQKEELTRKLEPYFRPTSIRFEVYKPLLHELLDKSMIAVQQKVSSWQDAISAAAQPLLKKEHIDDSYIDAMIRNVMTNGPYIVIAPLIAMPHARPEEGVKKLGISMLKVNEAVPFSNEAKHDARLIIVLAAIDNETHLKALSQLSELLSDKKNVNRILESSTAEDIEIVLHQKNEGGN
ncbi:BglG family transcription antiterminator [Bacillus sp. Marseille-P3800]|uniref:BglG family transcription antiterminator n=1 Tax=Bacillus sp. Marseille-P3800 TaxID=2014782 RepID=UPI000C06FAEC|nr:BglG family transcription antiterminator [Bacillus sp. Marseille-P3800]